MYENNNNVGIGHIIDNRITHVWNDKHLDAGKEEEFNRI